MEGACQTLDVSQATIRNWVKTGELSQNDDGTILTESMRSLEERIRQGARLSTRANKRGGRLAQGKSGFLLDPATHPDEADICYQESLSVAHRNAEGIYYTPQAVAFDILKRVPIDWTSASFLEPAAGSGTFVEAAISLGLKAENAVLFDTDPVALALASHRLSRSESRPRMIHGDFLSSPEEDRCYDVIATNPPWGRKSEKANKARVANRLGLPATSDSASLFFAYALRAVRPGGYVAFLLPEAFFNVGTFEVIRSRLLEHSVVEVVDHGRIFEGIQCSAKTVILRNETAESSTGVVRCWNAKGTCRQRTQKSFAGNPKKIINDWCDPSIEELLAHLLRQPHTTLKGRARWALGVVTGNNRERVRKKQLPCDVPVYRGRNITALGIQESSEYVSSDLSTFQQAAPPELYFAPEKLVYRFISERLVFAHDERQRLFLNSANILIPDSNFPLSQVNLANYFNTDLMNWLHRSLFGTHKILRGDLESLPIFDCTANLAEIDEVALVQSLGIERELDGTYRIAR